MHMKPGLSVICRSVAGMGQVTRLKDRMCEVVWPGGRREWHPESNLFWVGLSVRVHGEFVGRVIKLGRGKVHVRLCNGGLYWAGLNELVPRQPKFLEEAGVNAEL